MIGNNGESIEFRQQRSGLWDIFIMRSYNLRYVFCVGDFKTREEAISYAVQKYCTEEGNPTRQLLLPFVKR